MNLELSVVPIWNLIQRTSKEFHLPAKKKNIALNVNYNVNGLRTQNAKELPVDAKELKAVGDEVRLAQVLRFVHSATL